MIFFSQHASSVQKLNINFIINHIRSYHIPSSKLENDTLLTHIALPNAYNTLIWNILFVSLKFRKILFVVDGIFTFTFVFCLEVMKKSLFVLWKYMKCENTRNLAKFDYYKRNFVLNFRWKPRSVFIGAWTKLCLSTAAVKKIKKFIL